MYMLIMSQSCNPSSTWHYLSFGLQHVSNSNILSSVGCPVFALYTAAHNFEARQLLSIRSTAADRSSKEFFWPRDGCSWSTLQRKAHPCFQAWEIHFTSFPQDLPSCSPHSVFSPSEGFGYQKSLYACFRPSIGHFTERATRVHCF